MTVNVYLGDNTALALAAAQQAAADAATIASLPTTDPMVSGALWNDGGVRKLSAATPSGTPADGSITNAKLAAMPAARIKGRNTGTGAPEDLTAAQARTLLNVEDAATASRGLLGRFAVSGDIIVNSPIGNPLNVVTMTADTLWLLPLMPLAQDLTLSALAGYVTTGVASAKVRFGIYADNGGTPEGGALICDSGELDASTSSTAISGGVSVTLSKANWYWLAILANSTPALRAVSLAGMMPLPATGNLSATAQNTRRQVAQTYGALPSTCPTGTAYASSVAPAVGLVKA